MRTRLTQYPRGLGHGGRVHSPNEYATVQGMKDTQQWIAAYFLNLADTLAGAKGE